MQCAVSCTGPGLDWQGFGDRAVPSRPCRWDRAVGPHHSPVSASPGLGDAEFPESTAEAAEALSAHTWPPPRSAEPGSERIGRTARARVRDDARVSQSQGGLRAVYSAHR